MRDQGGKTTFSDNRTRSISQVPFRPFERIKSLSPSGHHDFIDAFQFLCIPAAIPAACHCDLSTRRPLSKGPYSGPHRIVTCLLRLLEPVLSWPDHSIH